MSQRLYSKTGKPFGAMSQGNHIIIPLGSAVAPGYVDVPPSVATDCIKRFPDEVTLDQYAAKQEAGIYTPSFKKDHFNYLSEMSAKDQRVVLEFLSHGTEKYAAKDRKEDWIEDRARQWMVGQPEAVESSVEKAVTKAELKAEKKAAAVEKVEEKVEVEVAKAANEPAF